MREKSSKYPGSARYKKTNSRPNTSVSKKVCVFYAELKSESRLKKNIYI